MQDRKYHEAAIKISIDELESLINVSVSKNGASIRSQQSVVQKLEKKVYCHTYSASLWTILQLSYPDFFSPWCLPLLCVKMFYNVTPTLQAFFIIEEGQIGCYVIVTY